MVACKVDGAKTDTLSTDWHLRLLEVKVFNDWHLRLIRDDKSMSNLNYVCKSFKGSKFYWWTTQNHHGSLMLMWWTFSLPIFSYCARF